jgi:hypothetical protein
MEENWEVPEEVEWADANERANQSWWNSPQAEEYREDEPRWAQRRHPDETEWGLL